MINIGKRAKTVFLPLFLVGFLLLGLFFIFSYGKKRLSENTIRIGYFHGGRTMLLFRAYINGELKFNNAHVDLYTKDLNGGNYYLISSKPSDITNNYEFGKVRGGELIDEMVSGKLDGATVGESSYIKAVSEGKPIIAVAILGHDTREAPAHAILIRKGLKIGKPQDLEGKVLVTRRAGDGDATFLREFLTQSGLDPEKDVKLVEQVDDNLWLQGIKNGSFDGGYFHEMAVRPLVESGDAYIYRRLDWVDPEMSQALLVFNTDFIKEHPSEVLEVIRAYMLRIKYEQSLPGEVRLQYINGMQMADNFQGMNLPQYSNPPAVSLDLLNSMQNLLIKQKVLSTKVNLVDNVDNSFVENISNENKN